MATNVSAAAHTSRAKNPNKNRLISANTWTHEFRPQSHSVHSDLFRIGCSAYCDPHTPFVPFFSPIHSEPPSASFIYLLGDDMLKGGGGDAVRSRHLVYHALDLLRVSAWGG